MPLIRKLLGAMILLLDWLTSPKGIKRPASEQQAVDQQTSSLTLYQFQACPFCVKVRRAMKRYTLNIPLRDAKRCSQSKDELLAGGGKLKVPCLRIENEHGDVEWMYESNDIVAYLENRFLAGSAS